MNWPNQKEKERTRETENSVCVSKIPRRRRTLRLQVGQDGSGISEADCEPCTQPGPGHLGLLRGTSSSPVKTVLFQSSSSFRATEGPVSSRAHSSQLPALERTHTLAGRRSPEVGSHPGTQQCGGSPCRGLWRGGGLKQLQTRGPHLHGLGHWACG